MEDELIVFIHKDKIDGIGSIYDEDDFHTNSLLEYAKKNHLDNPIFEKLNKRHQPETIAFFYTKLYDDIVFLNTTSIPNDQAIHYTKQGLFLLPDNISDNQKENLYLFLDKIKDYSIGICYDLDVIDGILDGKNLYSYENKTPKDMMDLYFIKKDKNTIKK